MSMKCVRMVHNNEIRRLPTNQAQKLVTAEKAVFVCKGIWRAYRRFLSTKEALMGENTTNV